MVDFLCHILTSPSVFPPVCVWQELIKSTDKTSHERDGLEQALEAMLDLSVYVNELKRDHEGLQVIEEIQNRWLTAYMAAGWHASLPTCHFACLSTYLPVGMPLYLSFGPNFAMYMNSQI